MRLSTVLGSGFTASLDTGRLSAYGNPALRGISALNVAWSAGQRRRGKLSVRAVGWDPEGILGAPQPGHISRRQMQKQLAREDQEGEKARAEAERDAQRKRLARQAREVPGSDEALVDFLLGLGADEEELEFEVARCGPRFNDAFFQHLVLSIGAIRLAERQSEEDLRRLAQLERLEARLRQHVGKQDALRTSLVTARLRLQELLSALDKKEKLLAMAAAGELDMPLLQLLDENIAQAQGAQQKTAVEFMEKVRGAVVKYMTKL